jgi:hypothetical protein
MTRFDVVNYISHGIAKSPRRSKIQAEEYSDKSFPELQDDWWKIQTFVGDREPSFLVERNGKIDLAPTTGSFEAIPSRIKAATLAAGDLIKVCRRGNQQHAALGDYAEQYRAQLDKLGPSEPGIVWYICAQKIENYRSNYAAVSRQQSDEYPPLEPDLSTVIDAVVLATGILARLFPEIAKSQDDFEKYSGRQVGVRRAERELLDAALSDLAVSQGVFTQRAAAAAKAIVELDPGVTPADASETTRVMATKSGFLRSFLARLPRWSLTRCTPR